LVAKPSKIGKYDVIDVIGRGGMGVVYKANDPHLNRLVAIKMMTGGYSDNPDLLKRFYREAQSTGNLQHPNIVTVYDLGDLEGNPYLVMEFLEGESLDAVINSHNPLSLITKINFICDVCHGLAYAHHQGIVHRDIKPGNIMVLKNGSVKIVDFGIAHFGDKTVTRTGQLIGSLGYMSPEQVNGKPIDTRTDIFSTGVVLYQLLTYALPFDGDSTAATLLKIIHDPPPPLKKYISDIPSELEDVILRSLAKDREDRYRTVEDFGFDLAQISDRLKQGLVEGHLREAESLFSRGLTHKAKELLLQVLKIDRQHTGAIRLFRTVQHSIEEEQIEVQIRQLRGQAEEAYSRQQFEAALGYVDKALNLHQTDAGLQSLRSSIRQARNRAEELQNLLHKAEAAHQEGDLEIAKKMVEETMELAPNDLQVKALFRVIHRDWAERSRQTKVESLVESARKEIASRRFTAALDVLKEAEALDPNAPNVKSLIESASAGREQERLRKELEAINLQIEEALDRDDFVTACQIIDQGLQRFPEDRSLLKLRSLAEKQRQVSERKRFIDEQLAQARALIQVGRNEEVLQLLEAALKRVGSDPHLHSLQVIVRETVERERIEKRKAEFLQRARECLRRKEFSEAIDTLNAASAEFQQDAEVGELLQFAKDEAAVDQQRKATEAVVEKARALIENDEYDQAVQLLEAELPEGVEEELGIALSQARHAAAEYQKRLDGALSASRKLLQNRKAAEAAKFLESQPASFRRNSDYSELLQQARREAERWHNIESAVERSRQLSGQRNFDEAFRALDECRGSWGDAPELQIAATEVENRRSADATEKLELVMADGRMLMMAKEYRAVIDRLKPAASLASVASQKLRAEFETLQAQATKALVIQRRAQIEQFLRKGEHREAADLLSGSQTEFPDNRTLDDLKKRLDDAVARRTEVQNLLHTARQLFAENSWKQGGEACVRAISLAALDPWLREQAIEVALRAADAALEKDWRSAETLVQDLTEVRAGTAVPASLRSRIAEKKREQDIQDAVAEVRGLQSSGDLPGALAMVGKHLAAFADDPALKALQSELQQQQRDQEERARLEQERVQRLEHLQTAREQLEREPVLESKIRILEEALRAYPDEVPFQQQLADLRGLTQRVAARAQQAKELEESRQFGEAIKVWEEIRGLDPHFSATERSLEQLRGLQRQELEARKVALIGQAQDLLAAHDLEAASELLAQVKSEFPDDPQVAELETSIEQRASTRTKALNLIAEGRKLVEKKKWDKGAESLQQAAEVGSADLPVRQEAVSALLQAAESATSLDLRSAESVVDLAARLDPSSAELAKVRANLESRKREAAVAQCLAASQKFESTGDLSGALSQLDPGLHAYPDEPQLQQRKRALEAQLRAAEAARQKEKQIAEHEQSAQRMHSAGDLQGTLARLQQGLAEFPGEPRLLRMKSAVDKSIADAEELKRREEERKRQEEQRKREEEERQRLREEKAAREAEKKRQEEAERLRLDQLRKREEEAAREAEKRKREEAEKLRLEQVRKREEEAAREAEKRKQEEVEKLRLEQERKREQKAAREAEKKKREEAETLRLEQARKRKEEAQAKAAEDAKRRRQERLARKEQAAAVQAQGIHLVPAGVVAKLAGTKLWWSAAAALVLVVVVAVVIQSFRGGQGTLVIRNAVPGTVVRIEKQTYTVGQDGTVSIPLKPGPHEVELAKDGYQSRELHIDIAGGKNLPLGDIALSPLPVSSDHLIPKPGLANGSLVIETGNKDVSVYIDSVKQNGGRRGTLRVSLPPVEHEIRAERPGYVTRSVRTVISSNTEQKIDLRLERQTVTPQHARLSIQAAPPGSQVFVDGQSKGTVDGNGTFSADVAEGDHQISLMTDSRKSDAITRHFAQGGQVQLDGAEFKAALPPETTEGTAWLQVQDSRSISALEGFLKRFPNSAHRGEAEPKLDDLYWQKATDANDVANFRDYQSRYPNGRHAQDAQNEIVKLDWQLAQNTSDTSVLEDFLKRYPSGSFHDQAAAKLDDLTWQRASRVSDAASLHDYLGRFPNGKHADQAHNGLDQLAASKPPARVETTVDERAAVLAVLQRYKKAYDEESVAELQAIWPGMGPRQISTLGVFFKSARAVTLAYNLVGEPEISGTSSTAKFTQSLNFIINGKQQKTSAQVTMQLKKAGPGNWVIETIR
jgi:serine/threonine-protein kinase